MLFLKTQTAFNKDIGGWDMSNVIYTHDMFKGGTAFNQDFGNWDISKLIKTRRTFRDSTTFNQDLTGWCVTNIITEPSQFLFNAPIEGKNNPAWGTCL